MVYRQSDEIILYHFVISAQRNSINPCSTLRHDKEIELFQITIFEANPAI